MPDDGEMWHWGKVLDGKSGYGFPETHYRF